MSAGETIESTVSHYNVCLYWVAVYFTDAVFRRLTASEAWSASL